MAQTEADCKPTPSAVGTPVCDSPRLPPTHKHCPSWNSNMIKKWVQLTMSNGQKPPSTGICPRIPFTGETGGDQEGIHHAPYGSRLSQASKSWAPCISSAAALWYRKAVCEGSEQPEVFQPEPDLRLQVNSIQTAPRVEQVLGVTQARRKRPGEDGSPGEGARQPCLHSPASCLRLRWQHNPSACCIPTALASPQHPACGPASCL